MLLLVDPGERMCHMPSAGQQVTLGVIGEAGAIGGLALTALPGVLLGLKQR